MRIDSSLIDHKSIISTTHIRTSSSGFRFLPTNCTKTATMSRSHSVVVGDCKFSVSDRIAHSSMPAVP